MRLHSTQKKDNADPDLTLRGRLQAPNQRNWHDDDDNVGDETQSGYRDIEGDLIDALTCDFGVPEAVDRPALQHENRDASDEGREEKGANGVYCPSEMSVVKQPPVE